MKNSHWLNEFANSLLEIKTRGEMKNYLKGIMTPHELDQLSTRLQIVRLLKKGVPQQSISKMLKVGVATVTRGSRELKSDHFQNV